jgi:hypothetical protein
MLIIVPGTVRIGSVLILGSSCAVRTDRQVRNKHEIPRTHNRLRIRLSTDEGGREGVGRDTGREGGKKRGRE